MGTLATTKSDLAPKLRRALGLWDLILYGIVVIQPTAPMPVFGVVSVRARGHVVTAVFDGYLSAEEGAASASAFGSRLAEVI